MTALPDSIIQNGLFCCWKYEERNERKTKVPYQPQTGLGAKSNDPSSFVPYKTAVQASGYDGIGIGIFNGICAIDLDNCVSDSGYYTQTAAEIVALMHSYTEYSPSGNGLHILFSAKGFQYDTKRFYIMNHQAGIEVYIGQANCMFHFMLHEFEGILFSNPESFELIAETDVVNKIREIRESYPTPEHINNSPETAPSKRLEKLIPNYAKIKNGTLISKHMGIDKILAECPHFREWIEQISRLGA